MSPPSSDMSPPSSIKALNNETITIIDEETETEDEYHQHNRAIQGYLVTVMGTVKNIQKSYKTLHVLLSINQKH